MQHTETSVQTIGGLELYVQRWQADVPTRAVIAIVHGFGEYGGRYMNLVNHLVPHGHVLCGVDLRGHGLGFFFASTICEHNARAHFRQFSAYRGADSPTAAGYDGDLACH